MINKKNSITSKVIAYSLNKGSFQINRIHKKIKKLLRKKKNKDIPSNPKE